MDSLTDQDLDRIFVRIQQQVDLKNISSKGELKSAIASKAKNWNNTLNGFYWERIKDERDVLISSAQRTEDYDDLRRIKREAESNKVVDATTISFINQKMDRIQSELAQITEERREKRLEEERIEKEKIRLNERIEKEQERLQSDDRRKRENAKRQLEKLQGRLSELKE